MYFEKTLGLIAAPPTGFLEDGSVDFALVAPLAEFLGAQGVSGVFVNGTTGEGASLTSGEREGAAEAWRSFLPVGMRLFVHVGHNSLGESRRLASHAEQIGADAVGMMVPGFFRPVGMEALVDACAEVAAAAPSLPFYLYHMPSMSGCMLSMAPFLRAAEARIPNLAGVKFTYEALNDYQECLSMRDGRFDILWGRDEMLLGALATGARGMVGSTYNVAAPLYLALIKAFDAGDLVRARALQLQAVGMINDMVATGHFFAALKSMLRDRGLPISPRVRSPLPRVDAAMRIPAVPDGKAVKSDCMMV